MTLKEWIEAINPIISDLVSVRDDAQAALRLKQLGLLGGAQNRANVRTNLTSRVASASTAMTALLLDSDT